MTGAKSLLRRDSGARRAQDPRLNTVAPGWGSTVNFAEDRRQRKPSFPVGLNVRCSVGLDPIAASRPPYKTPWRDG